MAETRKLDLQLRARAQRNELTVDDLYAAMTSKAGYQEMRKVLWLHCGVQSHPNHVAELINTAMPAQVEALRAREAEEAREAERERKELARAEKAKAAERAEQEKVRLAVEAARQRRQASFEAELVDEAKATLADTKS